MRNIKMFACGFLLSCRIRLRRRQTARRRSDTESRFRDGCFGGREGNDALYVRQGYFGKIDMQWAVRHELAAIGRFSRREVHGGLERCNSR